MAPFVMPQNGGCLCGVLCFHCRDVINDALRPTVDVRPSIAIADAVLVRSNIHHVRAWRPRGKDALVRLLVGNDDQPVEFAPLPLLVELRQRASGTSPSAPENPRSRPAARRPCPAARG